MSAKTAAYWATTFAGDGIGDILAPLGFLALVMASRALAPFRRTPVAGPANLPAPALV